jgi:hypothetical protein
MKYVKQIINFILDVFAFIIGIGYVINNRAKRQSSKTIFWLNR